MPSTFCFSRPHLPFAQGAALALTIALSALCFALSALCFAPSALAATVLTEDFSLPGADGRTVTLSRDPTVRLHVLCFLGTECPLARVYGPRLQQMADDYRDQGVQFIGVVSNVQDSMEDVQQYVEQHGIQFPVAKDYDHQLASAVGATRTPEVFVVDRAGNIRYQGRIDNQYQPGVARSEATEHDLRAAIETVLAGDAPEIVKTEAVGCLIGRSRGEPTDFSITFCNQISRVLRSHCVECHRADEIGPFSLEDYEEVVGWADMCLEVIDQGRMPPWHASPEHGSFANSRHMPETDKAQLRRWVNAGMPYGNPDDLPAPLEHVRGWRLPEAPDLVLSMSKTAFEIPAEGTVEYQYFVVDPGFTEDKWVRAAQVIPGNSAVVHHCIVFTRPPDGASFREIGLVSAYVPGQVRSPLPDGFAQKIPAGSRLVFQMHYTPNGRPQQDMTQIGLVFTDADKVTHEVIALGGIEQEFEIPPRASNHLVEGEIGWFPKNGLLLSIMPHMHLRGKSFQFRAKRGDQEETLLEVPAYDFNWQHNYELSKPLPLEDVDALPFAAIFDNSDANPFNPDPSELVTWGDQTWQEMAVVFLGVARPVDDPQPSKPRRPDPRENAQQAEQQAIHERKAKDFATRYLKRFDTDGDGGVSQNELPISVRIFSYRRLDHNGDGRIDYDEIYQEALSRASLPSDVTRQQPERPTND